MSLAWINLCLKSWESQQNIPGRRLKRRIWKTRLRLGRGRLHLHHEADRRALETRMLIDKLFDEDPSALIVVCGDFNEEFDEVSIEAIRGDMENTGNLDLTMRVMVPPERNIPEPARYSFLHNGKSKMLDHILVSRTLLAYFHGSEVHNELLHDESIVFTPRIFYPESESDHAPVVAEFELPE